jgi:pyruvate dehydrogenase E1 component alpha subunit
MTIPTLSYLNDKGELSKSCHIKISKTTIVKALKTMLTNRMLDERMVTLQRQGAISFAISGYGEECCSIASAAALKLEDWLYPQYREAGAILWRGLDIQTFIDGMFCNKNDIILGRQMPNHFGSRKLNVVTVSSPIATQIPQAAGCAYAMKVQKEKNIALTYFGDGATSEGDFHAGLNFAAVYKAPCIFFCRNNGFAISTSTDSQFASDGIAPKGIGYGMTTYRIDGNDFFAIYETVQKARQQCIEGKGPVLIEAMTYRLGAHSTSDDPSCYRQNKEVEIWEKKCPIKRLRNYLISEKLWNSKKEDSHIKTIKQEINNAIEKARHSEPPPLKSLFTDVYHEIPPSLQKQYDTLNTLSQEDTL